MPSKAYGVLAAGKPILYEGVINGEIAQTVVQNNVGLVTKNGDVNELYKAVLSLYENRKNKLTSMGERARMIACDKYSTTNMIESYTKVIESLYDK